MERKKIISLALAAVMALSMLAGCGTGGNGADDGIIDSGNDEPKTSAMGVSKQLYDKLSDTAQSKVTFKDRTDLDNALETAFDALEDSYIQYPYPENPYNKLYLGGIVWYVLNVNSNEKKMGLNYAANVLAYEMDAENEVVAGSGYEIEVLSAPENQDEKNLNVTLLFAVDEEIGINSIMEQIANYEYVGIGTAIEGLPLDNSNAAAAGDVPDLRYSYMLSASMDTRRVGLNRDKTLTLIAVNIAREIV